MGRRSAPNTGPDRGDPFVITPGDHSLRMNSIKGVQFDYIGHEIDFLTALGFFGCGGFGRAFLENFSEVVQY